jgi:AraC family transcriptional regulator, alkane utilization regulator
VAQPTASPGSALSLSGAPEFDLITDVMEQVRLEGMVYFRAALCAPFGISIARPGRTPFYAVTAGRCYLQLSPRGAAQVVQAGDLVVLPNAAPHVVRSGKDALVVPLEDWLASHPMAPDGAVVQAGAGPVTRVTGGFFSADVLRMNPLFDALPPVIHLRGSDPQVRRWLTPTLEFIHAEIEQRMQGGQTVLRRLADVLFIQAVRAYAQQDDATASWLRGMRDRRVGRALMLLHARFAQPWTLENLARAVGTSRTHLAVQFKALVGESPMNYLTRWRITRAANQLRGEHVSVSRAAEAVGYASDAVFSRAFRRVVGQSPAQWRKAVAQVPPLDPTGQGEAY